MTTAAGVRVKLLFHAGKCFPGFQGLGRGCGQLTEIWPGRSKAGLGIHCFLARIVADCGIFA